MTATASSSIPRNRVIMRCLWGPRPARRARAVVRDTLIGLDFAADQIADAELAVAELVSNAVRHAPPPYELRLHIDGDLQVTCAVVDAGTDHAELAARLAYLDGCARRDGDVAGRPETGRGLLVLRGLYPGACGVTPTLTCTGRPAKQVLFAVRRA